MRSCGSNPAMGAKNKTMKFKIGDKVEAPHGEAIILGFTLDKKECVVQHGDSRIGHSGDMFEYWYDDNGNKIPYIGGDNRRYETVRSLKLIKPIDLVNNNYNLY